MTEGSSARDVTDVTDVRKKIDVKKEVRKRIRSTDVTDVRKKATFGIARG